jgi:very-short-patch-repair endonuclease
MALLAITVARKVIIVGDDEQVSPLAIGQKQDYVDHLIKEHLDGIPTAVLYDGLMSVYDLAKKSFAGVICLLEHFRCVPSIIQYSNHLSYGGDIKPLREENSSPLKPGVVPFRVEGQRNDTVDINKTEAMTTASLVVAAIEHTEYRKQTFGVISLLGSDQAFEIEQILRRHIPPDEYQRRRIICGNSAQFQGDERDVMFLSMVWSSEKNTPLRFLGDKKFRQRFNVAASRACNQMWLVYSLDPSIHLQPNDLRRTLIEHALDPHAKTRDIETLSARTQSPFEREVLGFLVRAGYRVHPQWPVGAYRIDLVVEGGRRRVAIECDGDRFHPAEKLSEDMARQAILERLGWTFIRIRGSSFFRDRVRTMDSVIQKLEQLGIALSDGTQLTAQDENSLVQSITRRAAEIRADWNKIDNSVRTESDEPKQDTNDAGRSQNDQIEPTSAPSASTQGNPLIQTALFAADEGAAPDKRELTVSKQQDDSVVEKADISAMIIAPTISTPGERLIAALDAVVFPAMAGVTPTSTRLRRINSWRDGLGLCLGTPEELYHALATCDSFIWRDKGKVLAAIRKWITENPDGL